MLGVIVVKVEFDELEADWRRNSDPTYVVDQRGIVLDRKPARMAVHDRGPNRT